MNLWKIQEKKAKLSLHLGQARAWRSDRRFTFVLAGTQGGKTSFGPWWLYREIQECGAGDYLAVTASYDLFKLKMLPELRVVFETVLGIGRFWSGERVLELRNPETGEFQARRVDDPMWGRIILRSAQSSGGLESATAKAAWLDECGQDDFRLEDWEAIQRRLSLNQGRVLATTTLYNVGWLKSEVYERWTDGDPDIQVIQFPSYINPAFPRTEYERMRDRLQDWRFKMFYRGEFAQPAGLIYPDFSETMLVDPFVVPLHWERVVGVDFGPVNTATLWLAEEPDSGIWYAYRESLEGGKTSREHAEQAMSWAEGNKRVEGYGGAPSEDQQRMDWKEGGFAVQQPPISDVEAGIDRVTELIKTGCFRVFRTLKGLRDELGSYRRKLDELGEPTEKILDKRAYHRLDALRYAVAGVYGAGPPAAGVVEEVPIEAYVGRERKKGLWR